MKSGLELVEKLSFLLLDTERCLVVSAEMKVAAGAIGAAVVVIVVSGRLSLSIWAKSRNCSSTDVFHFSSACDKKSLLLELLCRCRDVFVTSAETLLRLPSSSFSNVRRKESLRCNVVLDVELLNEWLEALSVL